MIARRTPLKRSRKPIKARSINNSTKDARDEYRTVTAPMWMQENPHCFICGSGYNCAVHHMAGRGKFLNDTRYFRTLCFNCHRKVTDEPEWAKTEGHIIRILSINLSLTT